MAHLIETMAYANEVPWHGLGNNINADSPIEDWQRQSGLDWTVSKRPVHYHARVNSGEYTIKNAVFREALELAA